MSVCVLCLINYLSSLINTHWIPQPKHTFFCLDLTHCQHTTPITHKSECYQCSETVRDVQLCPGAPESPYQALYYSVDSAASGNSRAGTVPSPSLICGGCERQVQAAVVQRASESYLVSVDFWPLRKRAADEEEVFECSGGMARVGNLSVSTHMRTFASCNPGTVHLSASVSAPLGVWHLPPLPDFKPKQLHCFTHGTSPITHLNTPAISHHSRDVVTLHKHVH